MKILAFAASSSRNSINKQVVTHAANVLQGMDGTADVNIVDLNDFEMPIYSMDREVADGIPQLAQDFYGLIGGADGLIISYAEHNGNYTAAYKNIFDWCSRIDAKVFQGKPVVITSASPGPGGGAGVLNLAVTSAPYFNANVVGSFSVGPFGQKFDTETQAFTDAELVAELNTSLNALISAI
jgi:NAD(P)H-dependent FMN reductase